MNYKKGIVHVSSHHPEGELSEAELDRVEDVQRTWIDNGYGVAPVPADKRVHPEDIPCGFCSLESWEDQAWRDAYYIAWVGASNPVGVAATLAEASGVLLHVLGTAEVCKHPALRAIAAHLNSLYGNGLGPDDNELSLVVQNAARQGIYHN